MEDLDFTGGKGEMNPDMLTTDFTDSILIKTS
jgi:hypothetical protein